MDRFANNTFRTLAIIFISIFVILGSLLLLLFAICMGMIGSSGGTSRTQVAPLLVGSVIALILLIAFGVLAIGKLSKGIVRDTPEFPGPFASATAAPSSTAVPQVRPDVVLHLRPASRAAIRNLVVAVSVKALIELGTGAVTWAAMFSYSSRRPPVSSSNYFRLALFAWGIASIAPLLVLIYALLRHPGPRAFAYSLAIPAIHIFFGLFGHSIGLAFLIRSHTQFYALLTLLPWFLDFLILYLAWKAIRVVGIVPKPTRLVVASVVMFFYTTLIPPLTYLAKLASHHQS